MNTAPAYQDFKSATFTLAAGEEKPIITSGCRYLTIYKATAGARLEIKEKIDNWEGGFAPLPYGFSVGFMSPRGVTFRNPGAASATYTVLYGAGPFADNRQIMDTNSLSENIYDPSDLTVVPVATVGYGTAGLDNSGGGNFQITIQGADDTYNTKTAGRVIVTETFCIKIQTYTKPATGTLNVRHFTSGNVFVADIRILNYSVPAGQTVEYDLLQGQPFEPTATIAGYVGVYVQSNSVPGSETLMKAFISKYRARFKS